MNATWIQRFESAKSSGIELWLHCQPGAKKTTCLGLHGERLKVSVQAQPSDGQANAALIEWICKHLNTTKACVELVSGEKSRSKKFRIHQIELTPAKEVLMKIMNSK